MVSYKDINLVSMPLAPALKKSLKRLGVGVYFLALALIGTQLFFGDQIAFLANSLNLFQPREQIHAAGEQLTIGYAFGPSSLEPTLFDANTRSFLVNTYEGLVKTDRNLKIQPAIAISWGLLDARTWEFRLRPGVTFHNGSPVTVQDIAASLQRAKTHRDSQLKNLMNTVEAIQIAGEDRIRIKTSAPDPLLLNKLAVAYIFPAALTDFEKPVGTGPYQMVSHDQSRTVLSGYDGYWGEKPVYSQVELQVIPGRSDRIAALEKGEVQLLANVPPSVACSRTELFAEAEACSKLTNPDIVIKSVPSLEVSFLAFNAVNPFFSKGMRSAIAHALDPQVFVDLAFGFARPVGQFVSSGIFGFNPDIERPIYDFEKAQLEAETALAATFEVPEVTFDYPESLEAIGLYVQSQLADLGINVILNPLSDAELQSKIRNQESDFYFLGWRSELGDAMDFLQAAAHSRDELKGYGQFNGAHYMNKKVDQFIEKSQQNLDTESRLKDLQEAMRLLTEDRYGVPLYESEIIFAYNKNLQFEPRVDGYVYAAEIK